MCGPSYCKSRVYADASRSCTTVFVSPETAVSKSREFSCSEQRVNNKDNEEYLPTFRVSIIRNNKRRCVRGILDAGSQRSFIKEVVGIQMSLKVAGETGISFNTFGSAFPYRTERREIVEIRIRSQEGNQLYLVKAIVVHVICQDIAARSADSHFVQQLRLENKFLADNRMLAQVDEEPALSVLIGSDILWNILTGEVIRSTEVKSSQTSTLPSDGRCKDRFVRRVSQITALT
ncbi:hypothetical protein HPB50_024831 [Hyalomma asiaticum]|uniref:Uncharacterized protein n=1 Tax=Hyalomma asiaticum TaxID=266040 RepID=A0ACB7TE11_HYAAI|nr:hypothetical protein HPB50_024831 [Hyalomma asiaticum]